MKALACLLLSAASLTAQNAFPWPAGKRVAVSLTFDDARASQVTTGLDLFARHGVKATFYVNPGAITRQLDGWKRAVREGHEIGNHSTNHPCTGNFAWSRSKSLEEHTLDKLKTDFTAANLEIERMLGVKATAFAYPCGSKFVGRGTQTRSYVPLIARLFRSGRGFRDEAANDPAFCDMAQLLGIESDGLPFEALKEIVETAAKTGGWVIFAGHEIGSPGRQTTQSEALDKFMRWATEPAGIVWLDTVGSISAYIGKNRPSR